MSWTPHRVLTLKKLWAKGLSASQIAGQLGGVSRNAVIGKVHRLKLQGRATSKRTPRKTQLKPLPEPKRSSTFTWFKSINKEPSPKETITSKATSESIPLSSIPFMELRDGRCKHPYGLSHYRYCGKPTHGGASYCPDCAAKNYQPRGQK